MKAQAVLLGMLLSAAGGVAAAAKVPEPLVVQGDSYAPACAPQERASLKAQMIELAGGHQPELLWQLTDAMLCRDGEAVERLVLKHMPQQIVSSSYDAGEDAPAIVRVERSADYMARAQAWSASAQRNDEGRPEVSYWSNEACVHGFSFAPFGQSWMIVGVSGSCD